MATLNTTITDPLGASASGNATITVTRSGNSTVQKRTLYGHRLAFGDAQVNKKPLYAIAANNPAGSGSPGTTYVIKTYMLRNCSLTAIRFLKAPAANGVHTVVVWQDGNTTPLATKNVTLTADNGGWVEVALDSPVTLTASSTVGYLIGYLAASGNVVQGPYVYGSQDVIEYPFHIKVNGGDFGNYNGTGYAPGNTLTYPLTAYPGGWVGHSYYIDPVVTWPSDDAIYTGGTEYLQRFSSFAGYTAFPLGAWASLPGSVATFKNYGINLMVAPFSGDLTAQMNAIKANNIDVIPPVGINDLATLAVIESDAVYLTHVRGYLTRDEPDLVGPYTSPVDLQTWHAELRTRAPGKLLMFNLGYTVVQNGGFDQQPPGADMVTLNANWKQYAKITDITSCDFYMEDPANQVRGGHIYGLWCDPRIVGRLRDLNDYTRPTWHFVTTTAPPGTGPTPQTVYNSVWALLIGGAKGIVFFDTQFTASGTFITDNAMASNPAMASMVTSICSLVQSLAAPLLAPESALTVTVTSSNVGTGTAESIIGGEFGVPIHYTARQAGGSTYLFTQAIRPGTTTGTFTVPVAAGKTITVISESRTITADGSGIFSDNFTADYQVHLYQWS